MKYFYFVLIGAMIISLFGCPSDSKNEDPKPLEPAKKETIETLKINWDSCSVILKQSSRTVTNSVNIIQLASSSSCQKCNDYLIALVTEEQCGRDGWECYNRGNVKIELSNIEIGAKSSLGWLVNNGGEINISTIDNSLLFSGSTDTKNYQIKKIEIESFNNSPSISNGELLISTPECPGTNQNRLFSKVKINESNKQGIFTQLINTVNNQKWALAIKIKNLDRWCGSIDFKNDIRSLNNEKFSLETPKAGTFGTGEFIGQDIADLLIYDYDNIFDYSKNSTYFWKYDEVIIKSPSVTKIIYKRGITDESKYLMKHVADQVIHFEDNDSLEVLTWETTSWFKGTWKFTDKNYNKILINGARDSYGMSNVIYNIDVVKKHIFNFTRDMDLTNFNLARDGWEKYVWYTMAEENKIPETKFQIIAKMIPYR